MDSLQFDQYTNYSDDSTSAPRTPSPITMQTYNHKQLDIDHSLFDHSSEQNPAFWPSSQTPFAQYANRGSLLQELYDVPTNDHFIDASEPPLSGHSDWSQMAHDQQMHIQAHHQQQAHQQAQLHHHHHQQQQAHIHRRNTFPIVRHDRDGPHPGQQFFNPPFMGHEHSIYPASRPDSLYADSMGMGAPGSDTSSRPSTGDPSSLHEPFIHSMSSSPRGSFRDFDGGVKLEDAPVIVPSQTAFYRPPSGGAMHPMAMSYLSPHTGLPVQHTDDAASKETQYLRRRCFNCHTTEPPSWRRSTLNPGKIVCNKCGLYERTHLRPRPLRFDELRAGNKARKQTAVAGAAGAGKGLVGSPSPKQKLVGAGGLVKKEPREFGLVRRSSVSSTASSVHSGGGASSDWDDNVSVYSSGSGPSSSYNSPSVSTFPIPRDPNSQSPPLPGGGIRLPTNPLTDLACALPPRSTPAPGAYYSAHAYPTPPGTAHGAQHAFELRRGSLPVDLVGAPQGAGWQPAAVAAT